MQRRQKGRGRIGREKPEGDMNAGFPNFRGYGLEPVHEARLTALLAERCRIEGVSMGTVEASDVATSLLAAYLRAFRQGPPRHQMQPELLCA
jgi:hypothetical protein